MQRVTDMGLLGIVRPKIAPRTTTDPGMGTLTLAQAQRIANPSAAQGTTSPTSAHRAAPINGAPVPSMGKRRNTSVGDSFPPGCLLLPDVMMRMVCLFPKRNLKDSSPMGGIESNTTMAE